MTKAIIMKGRILLFLFSILILLASCKKEEEAEPENGTLKVTINYQPDIPSSMFLKDGTMKVELIKNNSTVATQYSAGTGTLDFGEYEYGSYTVKITGTVLKLDNGTLKFNSDINESKTFDIKDKTTTVTFDIKPQYYSEPI